MTRPKETFRIGGFDKPLFFTTLALLFVGFIMVFSASALPAAERYQHPFYFLIQQITGAVVGLGAMVALIYLKPAIYLESKVVYGLLALTLLLLSLCFIMPPVNGTNRWVMAIGLRFQPSELAKLSLILFLANYLERNRERLNEAKCLLACLGVIGLVVLLILREPDFGTSVLILFISFLILFVGGVKIRYLGAIAGLALALFIVYFQQLPRDDYRRQRWEAFLAPEEHRDRTGFQVAQSKLAVGSGGWVGVGLGESTQKLYFLPCAHTDFIYAIIGEEFGLLGTFSVLALYFLLFWRGLKVARHAPSLSQKLAGYGLTLILCSQALLNISIVLALGPTKGVPLPFVSYGRSALICNLVAVGLLLNISQRKPLNEFSK